MVENEKCGKEEEWKRRRVEKNERRKVGKEKGRMVERWKRRNRLDITINTQTIICFIVSFIASDAADCKSTETSEV